MFTSRKPPIGARPGTLAIPEGSQPPNIKAMAYSAAGCEEGEVTDLSELGNDPERVNWIDLHGLGDEEALRRIAAAFEIHPLALEDAVNAPQRPKSELYEKHMLIVARVPVRDSDDGELELVQVPIFVGHGYVVTFQERSYGLFNPVRERIRVGAGRIRVGGSDYLAYALLDTLVDHYYPVVEQLVELLDDLEAEVLTKPSPEMLSDLYRARRELTLLRRIGWPQREAINELLKGDSPFIGDQTRLHLRDTLDHMTQIVELADASRDVARAIMDMYLSALGHKTNEIMKVLTLLASIFIPLTFVAGIYGMNFEHMPELNQPWAYPLVIGLMLTIAAGMLLFFRSRGWLGTRRRVRKRRLLGRLRGQR
jgi:magnesium transporter